LMTSGPLLERVSAPFVSDMLQVPRTTLLLVPGDLDVPERDG
jgi:hypothetical protein